MNRWTKWLAVAVGLGLLPLAAFAEATPEAQKWLDDMLGLYDKAPFQADFDAEISAGPAVPMGGGMTGKLILKDRTHQRVEMRMEMGGQGGQGGMSVDMLSVTDGTTTWTEMNTPMGKQVIKIALEDMEKMAETQGLAPGMGSMDPLGQVEQLSKTMDFELVGVEGGKVTLKGTMTEEGRAALGNVPVQGLDTMTLVLDEKSSFPLQLILGGSEQPFLTLNFKNVKLIEDGEIPAGSFAYTPPEGVPVIDAAQMMGRMSGQGGQGGR